MQQKVGPPEQVREGCVGRPKSTLWHLILDKCLGMVGPEGDERKSVDQACPSGVPDNDWNMEQLSLLSEVLTTFQDDSESKYELQLSK